MKILMMFTFLFSQLVYAKIITEKIEYKDGAIALEGSIVYDSLQIKNNQKKPGVIVVHDWMGIGDYVTMRAEQLAKLGYVAFIADIYGQNIKPKDTKEASALASKYKSADRKEMRSRATAAFNTFKTHKSVNPNKITAMGYCFGGTVALEMARLGLPLAGVISFHGGLSATNTNDAKKIKTKLLILHGALDPYVKPEEVATFQKELNEAQVNYEFVSYSGAVHAFTEKHVGTDVSNGAAYNELADQRSFIAMQNFLSEVSR